jgi:hypothetical protein
MVGSDMRFDPRYPRILEAVDRKQREAMQANYSSLVYTGIISDDAQKVIANAIADILIYEYDSKALRLNYMKAIFATIEERIHSTPERK